MIVSSLVDSIVCEAAASLAPNRRCWTAQEDEFLRDNLGHISYNEVGLNLGRSEAAVKIRQVRQVIPSASKQPGWYTGNQVARILGIDVHSVSKLVKLGLLPCRILPGTRRIISIRQVTLFRWAVNPENWIYFRPSRVTHPRLRRLLELKASRWDDEWLTTGQVARQYGLACSNSVTNLIYRGKLPAKRWGNWWIKRSDVQAHRMYPGKGNTTGKNWSPRADAFILRARASGLQFFVIARMMRWGVKKVMYRYHKLQEQETT